MILVNGTATGQLDARDRGLHYGDGVFTTLRVREGEAALWERHASRLVTGCNGLGITPPNLEQLHSEVQRACVNTACGVLKIIITRGTGGRGYAPPCDHAPTRLVALYPWPDFPANNWSHGVVVRVNKLRLARNPRLAGIKHLNRLEQVLARAEWDDSAIAEGLMLDEHDHVIEATAANVFMVREGHVLTPALHDCGVAGVMRALIMQLAQTAGLQVRECSVTLNEARDAEEMFLTNSVIGVWPVRELDTMAKPIGPVTRHIAALLEQNCRAYA